MKIFISKATADANSPVFISESVSLAHAVTSFLQESKFNGLLQTADKADKYHPTIVKRLFKFLRAHDFDAYLLVCKRPIKPIRDDAGSRVLEKNVRDLDHAVIQVGQMVIDPCRQRMGSSYELPLSYPKPLIKSWWKEVMDVTNLALMTREHANFLKDVQNMQYPETAGVAQH